MRFVLKLKKNSYLYVSNRPQITMKRLFFVHIILFFSLSAVFGQVEALSNAKINKYFFEDKNEEIQLSIEVKNINSNQENPTDKNLSCNVKFSSEFEASGFMPTNKTYNFPLSFEKKVEDRYSYTVSIPANKLDDGRYFLEFECRDPESVLKYRLSEPITVGKFGIIQTASTITTNYETRNYRIKSINSNDNFIPKALEGIYTKGFCNDEILTIDRFNFHVWSNISNDDLELKAYYSIDNGDLVINNDFEIIDNSKDKKLRFGEDTYEYSFYNSEKIDDQNIELKIKTGNIIEQITNRNESEHSIKFYFELIDSKTGDICRLPKEDFFNLKFNVSKDPIGPNCQASLLPIDLLSWDAREVNKQVYIEWITVSEDNNDYFEVQRSNDIQNWTPICKIQGEGQSTGYNKYDFIDRHPTTGYSYYRLRQTDFDGTHKYSKYLAVSIFDNKLEFYPNPAKNYLKYNILDPSKQFKVDIINSTGKLIKTIKIPEKISETNDIDISELKAGIYLIRYLNIENNVLRTTKLIVGY